MQLTAEQVRELVRKIHTLNGSDGFDAMVSLTTQIEEGGWKFSAKAFFDMEVRGKRGYLLRKPKKQWKVGCAWVRGEETVFAHVNKAYSKAEAMSLQAQSEV